MSLRMIKKEIRAAMELSLPRQTEKALTFLLKV
jgi:hypothetical protein